MKKHFTLICFLVSFISFQSMSQGYKVDTLYKTGPLDKRVNIVILGDGFTQAELPKFASEAQKFADFFLGYAPYNRYKNYFNFFAIETPSKESGVTNPGTAPDAYTDQPVGAKDTFYGSTFGSSIHRLVTISKYDVMSNVLAVNMPVYDLVVVLVNTPFYGGSGGSIAVHTLHTLANTIGVHEIGHTFTHLNDEYWAGSVYGWEAPNMTANSDPSTIKWKNWLNTRNVGIYKHGEGDAARWFKPTESNCLMELLDKEFCNVCTEATTEKILQIVDPVQKIQPDTSEAILLSESDTEFNLDLLKPEPNSLQVEWSLNGNVIETGKEKINLSASQIAETTGVLTATVFDSTYMSRVDGIRQVRTRNLRWNLEKSNVPFLKLIVSNDSLCVGQSSILSAVGCSGILTWSTGTSSDSLTVSPTETTGYTASCKFNDGTTITKSTTITVLPLPVASATNGGPYLEGNTIQLSADGGNSYDWSGPNNFKSQLPSPTIASATIANSGVYEVKVISEEGCSSVAQTNVKVDPILSTNPNYDNSVLISPNPARDYIKIKTTLAGESSFTLYNLNGISVSEKVFKTETSIKVSNLSKGIYLYRISNGQKELTGKIALQ